MACNTTSKFLALTAGEPAGIGPELCLALAGTPWADRVVVITDPDVLLARAGLLGGRSATIVPFDPEGGAAAPLPDGGLRVWPQRMPAPATCGRPDPANARSLLDGLRMAVDGCSSGQFGAMITAPLQKSVMNDAGFPFTGHTEYLAELTGTSLPVMLLVAGSLRVALASTHLPLSAVPAYITSDRLRAVVNVLHADLRSKFGIHDPDIVVCGLNPHAGEAGHLGREEIDIIEPVVREFRSAGIRLRGPLPADTAFTPAAGRPDAVLAMYHDQGLPVLKYASFGRAVNVTLGLPIIRTSVDHGTALDIAGTGSADAGSLLAAVELAAMLADA